jgi:hypothetical protein
LKFKEWLYYDHRVHFSEKIGGDLMSDLEQFKYETGTSIQTFNIIQTSVNEDGYEVLLNIDLDSGYELEDVRLKISFEDLTAYETKDIHEGVKYALGFFEQDSDILQ